MILLDANVLLYAYNAEAHQHAKVAAWLEEVVRKSDLIGLPWLTLWAFLRISTNARIWPNPKSPQEAFDVIHGLLAQRSVATIHPGPRHVEILERLVTEHRAASSLVTDAALAALAIENGAELASCDQDFSRFTGLRWINPLA
jgi:hypothetical protein